MKQYIGCDLHRDYSVFASVDETGRITGPWRVDNEREGLRAFLRRFPSGTQIAVEETGSWYWMIDELEGAGSQPMLADSYVRVWLWWRNGRPSRTALWRP